MTDLRARVTALVDRTDGLLTLDPSWWRAAGCRPAAASA